MNSAKPRILVVDDSEEMRTVLKKLLAGYGVVTADNGEAGLRAAAAETPAVVLLDVNMPGMSGLDVLEKLNRLKPRPAVIMVTVDTGEGTGIRALSLGAFGYLTKPFESARVLEAVDSALSEFARRLLTES